MQIRGSGLMRLLFGILRVGSGLRAIMGIWRMSVLTNLCVVGLRILGGCDWRCHVFLSFV